MTNRFLALFLLLSIISAAKAAIDRNAFKRVMEAYEIIPHLTDTVPSAKLTVKFPSGKEADLGRELKPSEVKDQPNVSWEADNNKYYLLAMVDPDAPSRYNRALSEVKHWLVGNIKGNDISSGDVIAEYIGSGPPKDTGFHRYPFLLYEQKSKLSFNNEPKSKSDQLANRPHFSMKNFAKKYDLGAPIAVNFFEARWEPYVDESMKRFKDKI